MSHHLQSEADQTIPPEGSTPLPFPTTDPVQLSSWAGTGAQEGGNPSDSCALAFNSFHMPPSKNLPWKMTRSGGALCEQVGGFQHFSCLGFLPDTKLKVLYN